MAIPDPGPGLETVPLPMTSAIDLATLAMRMLELASPALDAESSAAIDLGAAALAVHVCDWHFMPVDATRERKQQFGLRYPAWSILVDVVNGAKHPHRKIGALKDSSVRRPEWEDADFWLSSQQGEAVFIVHDGTERALRALVREFCSAYIAHNPVCP